MESRDLSHAFAAIVCIGAVLMVAFGASGVWSSGGSDDQVASLSPGDGNDQSGPKENRKKSGPSKISGPPILAVSTTTASTARLDVYAAPTHDCPSYATANLTTFAIDVLVGSLGGEPELNSIFYSPATQFDFTRPDRAGTDWDVDGGDVVRVEMDSRHTCTYRDGATKSKCERWGVTFGGVGAGETASWTPLGAVSRAGPCTRLVD